MSSLLQTIKSPDFPVVDNRLSDLIESLQSVLIGKPQQIRLAMACLLARGHLLIEDVPGVGKTTLAHALAAALGLDWNRIQFTSDLLPSDIIGVSIFNQNEQQFEFHKGPIFTSVLLADEINRAPPKVQSALLEAMEERQVSIDGHSHSLDKPFFVIATQNPKDQLGAYKLPESQLDRFLLAIELGYPDPEAERQLLRQGDQRESLSEFYAVANSVALKQWQKQAASVYLSEPILEYVQNLLHASRHLQHTDHGSTVNGLSPRAGLKLIDVSKAWAFLQGRDMVLPEDVQAVFPALAGHRLAGSVCDGKTIAESILQQVAVNPQS